MNGVFWTIHIQTFVFSVFLCYSRHGIKKSLRTWFWGASRAAFRVRKNGLRTRFAQARKIASRTQNRVAYANRVRKSRTQIAPSVRKSHSVKSQQKSRTQIENRVRKSRPARLDFAYATRFAYAILRTRFLKNPPKSATENRVRKSDWRTRFAYANAIRAA